MSGRLDGKVALVIGAGQTAGDTIGNGRATALLFAREGARVVAVDRRLDSAEETVAMIASEGGSANACEADATREADCEALVSECLARHQRIDVLHNNVIMPGLINTPMAIEGISSALGVAKEELIRRRDAQVPLCGRMGTAWDVAHAALFLASDEAGFITGVALAVDGGQSARIG